MIHPQRGVHVTDETIETFLFHVKCYKLSDHTYVLWEGVGRQNETTEYPNTFIQLMTLRLDSLTTAVLSNLTQELNRICLISRVFH